MISAFNPDYHFASNAVDGITVCPNGLYTIHTDVEFMPCIKIDLQNIADVIRVIVFNRQDNNGIFQNCTRSIKKDVNLINSIYVNEKDRRLMTCSLYFC